MGFVESVKICLKKYATFTGRASRSEFWYFALFMFLSAIILAIFQSVFMGSTISHPNHLISDIFTLAIFIPSVAVYFRRLHDVNRSGWWQFIWLTVIGIIPLIYWTCKKGTEGDNPLWRRPASINK